MRSVPDGFNNRLEANWKPLLAIAELCGKGEEARAAAKTLSHRASETSVRIELLRDLVSVLHSKGVERMHTQPLAQQGV